MKIYWDYDSVLNKLHEAWFDWIDDYFGVRIASEEVLYWDYIQKRLGEEASTFFKCPSIYQFDIVKRCEETLTVFNNIRHLIGNENIKIISATWPVTKVAKNAQICRYMDVREDQIINEYRKEDFTSDGILIDDNIKNVYRHCSKNKKRGIVFDRNGKYGWSKHHNLTIDQVLEVSS
ncbi:MAG TPA: hypothetical protein VLA13_07415, partial [Massilibacterium sp.]|nr:hypothetical protein [Massilibacterium sp.]